MTEHVVQVTCPAAGFAAVAAGVGVQLLGELVVGRDHRHLQRRLADDVERVPADGDYLDRAGIVLAYDVDVQDQLLEDPDRRASR